MKQIMREAFEELAEAGLKDFRYDPKTQTGTCEFGNLKYGSGVKVVFRPQVGSDGALHATFTMRTDGLVYPDYLAEVLDRMWTSTTYIGL